MGEGLWYELRGQRVQNVCLGHLDVVEQGLEVGPGHAEETIIIITNFQVVLPYFAAFPNKAQ